MNPLRLALSVLMVVLPLHAQQDRGVSLTIRFVDGTNRFHVGEVVPIELLFRASISNTYDMEMRNYDRSGRLNIEQFHVNPVPRQKVVHL